MEWTDDAIILSARPHGETAAIVTVLAAGQGRHAGLLPGGQSRSWHGVLQPGNHVMARWRARLPEHLGNFTLDLHRTHAAAWLDQPLILAAISSACAMTEAALPERQPMPSIYAGLLALLSVEDADLWGPAYIKWEIGLLAALGYGLDLSQCAVNGTAEDLHYVSPRTGRAVSRDAGAAYHEKLLMLPSFLTGAALWATQDIVHGLELTGHFLMRHVFAHAQNRLLISRAGELPAARLRLMDLCRKHAQDKLALEQVA